MDETHRNVIERITERYPEAQLLNSGHEARVFYNCEQLSSADLARLAAEAVGDLPLEAFDVAVGIAYAGILFAAAVAAGRDVVILQHEGKLFGPDIKGKKVVIVDDVVHSGRRLVAAKERCELAGGIVVGYACIVDRSVGKEALVQPIWSALKTDMS